jgi:hypothetical protein
MLSNFATQLLNKNLKYQFTVDLVAEQLQKKSAKELIALPNLSQAIENGIELVIWHHEMVNEEHHFVVQAQRRVFLFFWKNFLKGIIVRNNLEVMAMSREIAANYD